MPSARVYAVLCSRSPAPRKGSGRPRRWTFSYEDIAALLGVSKRTVRLMVKGAPGRPPKLDPSSLEALCFAWARRQGWARAA